MHHGVHGAAITNDTNAMSGQTTTPSINASVNDPACCFCANGGEGSGACLEVSACEKKPTYSCKGTGSGGCEWSPGGTPLQPNPGCS